MNICVHALMYIECHKQTHCLLLIGLRYVCNNDPHLNATIHQFLAASCDLGQVVTVERPHTCTQRVCSIRHLPAGYGCPLARLGQLLRELLQQKMA